MKRIKLILKWVLGVGMTTGGLLHFYITPTYMRIMPPYLPWHRELVYLSGVVEAGFGFLLLFRRTERLAAWGLIATLLAIFPANIQGSLTAATDSPAMPGVSPLFAWLRLPLQAVLIWWAYWYTKPEER